MRRKRGQIQASEIAAKVRRAEVTGEKLAVKRGEITQILDLACLRLRASSARTSAAIEGTVKSTLPPPGKVQR